jgi:copper chaperone CopZ
MCEGCAGAVRRILQKVEGSFPRLKENLRSELASKWQPLRA